MTILVSGPSLGFHHIHVNAGNAFPLDGDGVQRFCTLHERLIVSVRLFALLLESWLCARFG
jgi:hypothetical protein